MFMPLDIRTKDWVSFDVYLTQNMIRYETKFLEEGAKSVDALMQSDALQGFREILNSFGGRIRVQGPCEQLHSHTISHILNLFRRTLSLILNRETAYPTFHDAREKLINARLLANIEIDWQFK